MRFAVLDIGAAGHPSAAVLTAAGDGDVLGVAGRWGMERWLLPRQRLTGSLGDRFPNPKVVQ
ncbi:MAG: hypothetical protein ACRDO1_17085 [Nocardioidaceae bacterium]